MVDVKEIERRLEITAQERARSDRRLTRPLRVDDRVRESGIYREVSLGPDVYMAKGQKVRLHRERIGWMRVD